MMADNSNDNLLASLNKSLISDPSNVDLLLERSKLFLHSGNFEEAFKDVKRALQIEPKNVIAQDFAKEIMQRQFEKNKIAEDLGVPSRFKEALKTEREKFDLNPSESIIDISLIQAVAHVVKLNKESGYCRQLLKEKVDYELISFLKQQLNKAGLKDDEKRHLLFSASFNILSNIFEKAVDSHELLSPFLDLVSSKNISLFSHWETENGFLKSFLDYLVTLVNCVKSLESKASDNLNKKLYQEFVKSTGVLLCSFTGITDIIKSLLKTFPNLNFFEAFINEDNELKNVLKCCLLTPDKELLLMLFVQFKACLPLYKKQEQEDEAVKKLAVIITSLYQELFAKDSKISAIMLVSCSFQVHIPLGKIVLTKEGFLYELVDCLEFEAESIQKETLELLSNACADKDCRSLIELNQTCKEYLNTIAGGKVEGKAVSDNLKNLASIVRTKLESTQKKDPLLQQQGNASNSIASTEKEKINQANLFIKQIIANSNRTISIEGLALLTVNPGVKEAIAENSKFLATLLSLSKEVNGSEAYGIALIIDFLTAYKQRRSEEEEQIQKLREFAKETEKEVDDPRNNNDTVNGRVIKLVNAGVLGILFNLSKKATSDEMKLHLASAFVSCANQVSQRGKMVQAGAVRAVLNLSKIEDLKKLEENGRIDPDKKYPKHILLAAQALAKLAITQDPHIAFTNTATQLIRPFLCLLDSPNELYQFESLMALTNLCSMRDHNGQTVMKHLSDKKNLALIQNALFSDNKKVQQAAMETICNLVSAKPCADLISKSANWMKLVVALCDAEEYGTRIAASGALAILCNVEVEARKNVYDLDISPRVICTLLKEDKWEIQWRCLEIIRPLLRENKEFISKLTNECKDVRQRIAQLSKSSNENVQASAIAVMMNFDL